MQTNAALRIILLGPPGSGKGTQATRICSRYNLGHVSTGDILRRNIQQGTELGSRAKACMEAGELVPDGIIFDMLEELYTRREGDRVSFILDGFPRSRKQAEALTEFLDRRSQTVHKVLMLELEDEEIVGRLTERRTCTQCGRSYHLTACPPLKEGFCDEDGAALVWRADDREDVIRSRLKTYHSETRPVAGFFQKTGILSTIPAADGMEVVEQRISSILDELIAGLDSPQRISE